jgi:hypothetical protein
MPDEWITKAAEEMFGADNPGDIPWAESVIERHYRAAMPTDEAVEHLRNFFLLSDSTTKRDEVDKALAILTNRAATKAETCPQPPKNAGTCPDCEVRNAERDPTIIWTPADETFAQFRCRNPWHSPQKDYSENVKGWGLNRDLEEASATEGEAMTSTCCPSCRSPHPNFESTKYTHWFLVRRDKAIMCYCKDKFHEAEPAPTVEKSPQNAQD